MPKEIEYLELAMVLISILIKDSPPPIPLLSLNIYFLDKEPAKFSFYDENVLGCYNQFIFFPVTHWRKHHLMPDEMLVVIIEELCHAIWQIPDGPLIENKVEEVFKAARIDFNYSEFLKKLSRVN